MIVHASTLDMITELIGFDGVKLSPLFEVALRLLTVADNAKGRSSGVAERRSAVHSSRELGANIWIAGQTNGLAHSGQDPGQRFYASCFSKARPLSSVMGNARA